MSNSDWTDQTIVNCPFHIQYNSKTGEFRYHSRGSEDQWTLGWPVQTSEKEAGFFEGHTAAYRKMLRECLSNLDYDETKLARVVLEREEALVVLRRLCMEFGDMEWDENLHLADIIDKHLGRHLDAGS